MAQERATRQQRVQQKEYELRCQLGKLIAARQLLQRNRERAVAAGEISAEDAAAAAAATAASGEAAAAAVAAAATNLPPAGLHPEVPATPIRQPESGGSLAVATPPTGPSLTTAASASTSTATPPPPNWLAACRAGARLPPPPRTGTGFPVPPPPVAPAGLLPPAVPLANPAAAGPSVDASNAGGAAAAHAEAEDEGAVSGAETDDLHLQVDDHATFAWPGGGDGTMNAEIASALRSRKLHIGPKHTLQFVSTQTPSHIDCDSTPDGKEIVLTFEHPFSVHQHEELLHGLGLAVLQEGIEPSSLGVPPLLVEYAKGVPLATVAEGCLPPEPPVPLRGG